MRRTVTWSGTRNKPEVMKSDTHLSLRRKMRNRKMRNRRNVQRRERRDRSNRSRRTRKMRSMTPVMI